MSDRQVPPAKSGRAEVALSRPSSEPGPCSAEMAGLATRMRKAARVAGIDDEGPLSPLLETFMLALQRIGEWSDRQDRTSAAHAAALNAALVEARKSADAEAERFRARLDAAKAETIHEVSHHIARSADAALARRVRVFDRNTALIAAGVLVAGVLGAFGGGVWWGGSNARASIQETEVGLAAAFDRGPDAAQLWLDLMTWNDVAAALAQCTRNPALVWLQNGRRACHVPLWVERPVPQPPPLPAGTDADLAETLRQQEANKAQSHSSPAETTKPLQTPGSGVMHFGP